MSRSPTPLPQQQRSSRHHHHHHHHHRPRPELFIVCADNSDWMRNEDYCTSRWAAQRQALALLAAGHTPDGAAPARYALVLMAPGSSGRRQSGSPALAAAPGADAAAFMDALDAAGGAALGGACRVADALRLALMAARSAAKARARVRLRVVVFAGSPPADAFPAPALRRLAGALRRAGASADVFCFGEPALAVEWAKTFEEFVRYAAQRAASSSGSSRAGSARGGGGAVSDVADSHFVKVPPYGSGGGVDSLSFHILRTLVRDRDTAKLMWRNAFGTTSSASLPSPSPSPPPPPSRQQVDDNDDDDEEEERRSPPLVDRWGVPILRMPPPSESCRQSVASSEAFQSLYPSSALEEELIQQQHARHSVAFTLSLTTPDDLLRQQQQQQQQQAHSGNTPAAAAATTTTTTTTTSAVGGVTTASTASHIVLLLPVQQLAKEVLREVPAGRVVVTLAGSVISQQRRGSLALNRISPTLFQFVWRDRASGTAEYEVAVMRGEARTSLRKRPDGRILALELLRHSRLRMVMFWLQSADSSGDQELIDFFNEHLDASALTRRIQQAREAVASTAEKSVRSLPNTPPPSPLFSPPSLRLSQPIQRGTAKPPPLSDVEDALFGPRPLQQHPLSASPSLLRTQQRPSSPAGASAVHFLTPQPSPPASPRLAPLPSPDQQPANAPPASPHQQRELQSRFPSHLRHFELHYDTPGKPRALPHGRPLHPRFPSSLSTAAPPTPAVDLQVSPRHSASENSCGGSGSGSSSGSSSTATTPHSTSPSDHDDLISGFE